MVETKKYFKVVSVRNGKKGGKKLFSAVTSNPYLKQQYFVKKWVKAKVGGFLVFEKCEQALSFLFREYNENTHFVVYECAVKEYKKIGGFTNTVFETMIDKEATFEKLERVWRGDFTSGDTFPSGSRAYEEIKLTRKIAEIKGCGGIKIYR